jgi:diguanylate cyclase (GGDEF)-like protein/PAS domain S-box-containing protein
MLLIIANYTALIVYLFMGFHSFYTNPRERLSRLFLAICLLLAHITLFELLIFNTADPAWAYWLNQVEQLGWLNYPGLLLMMCLIASRTEHYVNTPLKKIALYLPGIMLSFYELFINDYALRNQTSTILITRIEYVYTYIYLFLCLLLLWYWQRSAATRREKKQSSIILGFAGLAFICGALSDLYLSGHNYNSPCYDQFIFLLLIFAIWYVRVKYQFMSVSSLITADDIVCQISEIVLVVNKQGQIADLNAAGLKVLGCNKEEVVDGPLEQVLNVDFSAILAKTAAQTSLVWPQELDFITRRGLNVPVNVSISTIRDRNHDFTGLLLICQDKTLVKELQFEINRRKAKETELEYLIVHDSLTGLFNRTYFEQQMSTVKGGCSIIVFDIDGLKLVNDTFGHIAGDSLLINAATIIQSALGDGLSLARIGGDEFAVLIPHSNRELIHQICASVNQAVEQYNRDNPQLMMSISMGFAVSRSPLADISQLYREADDNMCHEKLNHMQSFRSGMVQGMMKTLEARDFITEGHAERLREQILKLGGYAGLRDNMLTNLQLLAQFHDIGKVGISDKILFKPGLLTDSERLEMQRHSEIGYRIAQSIPELSSISDLILKHHERWDGRGYPLGIKGRDIPLECRILAIIDAYDAMTNDRPYRRAMSVEEALAELRRNAGTQFDPELVVKFLNMLTADCSQDTLLSSPNQEAPL